MTKWQRHLAPAACQRFVDSSGYICDQTLALVHSTGLSTCCPVAVSVTMVPNCLSCTVCSHIVLMPVRQQRALVLTPAVPVCEFRCRCKQQQQQSVCLYMFSLCVRDSFSAAVPYVPAANSTATVCQTMCCSCCDRVCAVITL